MLSKNILMYLYPSSGNRQKTEWSFRILSYLVKLSENLNFVLIRGLYEFLSNKICYKDCVCIGGELWVNTMLMA
jgi:hypothetical protein